MKVGLLGAVLLAVAIGCSGDDPPTSAPTTTAASTSLPSSTSTTTTTTTSRPAPEGGGALATAEFTMTYRGSTTSYAYRENDTVPTTLEGRPVTTVGINATAPDDPLAGFYLTGQVAEGEQPTSATLRLRILIAETLPDLIVLSSQEGECTITVESAATDAVAGSFSCDTTSGDEPLTAAGTFSATRFRSA